MEIDVVKQFEQWLMEDGKASTTISSYINDINKFNVYLVERDYDSEVLLSRFYFTSYIKHLRNLGTKVNTINKKITSLKVYNDWLFKKGMVDSIYINIKRDKVKVAHGDGDHLK